MIFGICHLCNTSFEGAHRCGEPAEAPYINGVTYAAGIDARIGLGRTFSTVREMDQFLNDRGLARCDYKPRGK